MNTVIPVEAMSGWEPSHSNNELREVSRGHSTSKKKKMREGPNNRKSEETEEGGQHEESRIPRKRGLPAKG